MRQQIEAAAISPAEMPEAETIVRRFRFPEAFAGFAGHFPGYPILPAVVQMLIALALAEAHHGGRLQLLAVEKAKFLLQLRPGQPIAVECRRRERGGRLSYEARLRCGEETAAVFSLAVAAQEER
jgi:3-hydroxyacyl-[acyl-carrier-protein] dehydratase